VTRSLRGCGEHLRQNAALMQEGQYFPEASGLGPGDGRDRAPVCRRGKRPRGLGDWPLFIDESDIRMIEDRTDERLFSCSFLRSQGSRGQMNVSSTPLL
jgi:hypothetical protein